MSADLATFDPDEPPPDLDPIEESIDDWRGDEADAAVRDELLRDLALVAHQCDRWAQNNVGTNNPAGLLPVAEAFKRAEETIADARKVLENRAANELPYGSTIGRAEVGSESGQTEIDWERAVAAVVAKISDEPGILFDADGERVPAHESAARLAKRLNDCIGFRALKKTGFDPIGLKVNTYAKLKSGRRIVWHKDETT